jgi:hypothetical protein
MQQIKIYLKQKSAPFMKHFLICNNLMVQHIDLSWNTVEPSVVLMYQKLVGLGLVYCDSKIRIIEPETEENNYHVDIVPRATLV